MSMPLVFSNVEQSTFLSLIEQCHTAFCTSDFLDRAYPILHKISPHEKFLCGIIAIPSFHIKYYINVNFPENYFRCLVSGDNYLYCPVARNWYRLRMPIYCDRNRVPAGADGNWLQKLDKFEIKNIVVHGLADIRNQAASYFSFAGVKSFGEHENAIMQVIVPHLHIALTSALRSVALPHVLLSRREREVLQWICVGKTNEEIGQLLGISPWTAKIHVKNLMRKLKVSSREYVITKAFMLGIVGLVGENVFISQYSSQLPIVTGSVSIPKNTK